MSNPNLSFSATLASSLADYGVTAACISPGSRNTPLIAGFAAEDRIRKWPILDERSAGFFGVGLGRANGRPTVLVCTSGTAAAEYHPAVVEARQSNVPLLVLTADRPPELRGVGAPQTIDQISLFGSSPLLFRDIPPPDDSGAAIDPVALAAEAVSAATTLPRGPVHVNVPFREPLLTATTEENARRDTDPLGKADGPPVLGDWAAGIAGRRGIIVAGRSFESDFPSAVAALAAATGYPVLADPLSGVRHSSHPEGPVLAYGDALAGAGVLDALPPEVVIRLGPIPTSKPQWQWLEANRDIEQILIEASGQDATGSATEIVTGSPAAFAAALARTVTQRAPGNWTNDWLDRDAAAGEVIRRMIGRAPFPNEPAIAKTVVENCPPQTLLTVGSSMPIRDVDAFGGNSSRTLTLFGNRGTNGIDGVVSAALGTAATGRPAVALVGDVSMFHDLNAIGTMAQLDLPLTIVVINNDGGGIFHFLPQADPALMDPETFETFLGTPHGTDFVALAHALGIECHRIDSIDQLAALLSRRSDRPRLLEVRTDRNENHALHRSIAAAVRAAVA